MGIEIKTQSELDTMREVGHKLATALADLCAAAQPGTTLLELDQLASHWIKKFGATSSFLGYYGYPKVLCTSVNEVVVHGIPDSRKLVEGDIVGIDFGFHLNGFHADSARTVGVGKIAPSSQKLIDATKHSLDLAIAQVYPNQRIGDIGAAVQTYIEAQGLSVVRDFVGHGIGRKMHEEPQVPNYGQAGKGAKIRPGLVLAIEPMVNAGHWGVEVLADQWTVKTKDRQWSAHFEDTVGVFENKTEIFTRL